MQVLAYHGSPNDFEQFDYKKIGSESGTSGAGFGVYFSTSKADALTYGGIIYTCMLELKTNIDNHKVTFTETQLKAILKRIEQDGKSFYDNFQDFSELSEKQINVEQSKIVRETLKSFECDTDIIGDIINSCYGGQSEELLKILNQLGFSHTQDFDSPDDDTISHYIVYDIANITIQSKERIL